MKKQEKVNMVFGKFEASQSLYIDLKSQEVYKEDLPKYKISDMIDAFPTENEKLIDKNKLQNALYKLYDTHKSNYNVYQIRTIFDGIRFDPQTNEYVTNTSIEFTSRDHNWIPIEKRKNVEFRSQNPIELFSVPNMIFDNLHKIRYLENDEFDDLNKRGEKQKTYILPTPQKLQKEFAQKDPLNRFSQIQHIDRSNSVDQYYYCSDAKYGKHSVSMKCDFSIAEGWAGGFETKFRTESLVFPNQDVAIKTIGEIRNIFDSMRPTFEQNIQKLNINLIQPQLQALEQIKQQYSK